MAETVNYTRITVRIEVGVMGDDGAVITSDDTYRWEFANGTGQYQIGNVYSDRSRTINTTTASLDLDGLTDFQGASTSTFNNVKFLFALNQSETGDLIIGGGDWATMFGDSSDKVKVKPKGMLLAVAPLDGYAITASTGDVTALETTADTTFRLLLGVDNT